LTPSSSALIRLELKGLASRRIDDDVNPDTCWTEERQVAAASTAIEHFMVDAVKCNDVMMKSQAPNVVFRGALRRTSLNPIGNLLATWRTLSITPKTTRYLAWQVQCP